jgi:hypothetical protein
MSIKIIKGHGYLKVWRENACGASAFYQTYIDVDEVTGGGCTICPRIFPNPSEGEIKVDFDVSKSGITEQEQSRLMGSKQFVIYNLQGETVLAQEGSGLKNRLDTNQLKSGHYILEVIIPNYEVRRYPVIIK